MFKSYLLAILLLSGASLFAAPEAKENQTPAPVRILSDEELKNEFHKAMRAKMQKEQAKNDATWKMIEQIAREYREATDPEVKKAHMEKLHQQVAAQYYKHLERSKKRIEELRQKLQSLEQDLQKRTENAEKVIQFQTQEAIAGKFPPKRPAGRGQPPPPPPEPPEPPAPPVPDKP